MTGPGAADVPARPAGPASITDGWRYVPAYLPAHAAHSLLSWLLAQMPWQEERIHLFGRERLVPRLIAWCGDQGVCYRYSGRPHAAHGWPPLLQSLRDALNRDTGENFNFLLLNRYRDGGDSMGWHRDDEVMASTRIVSLSLGAERRFRLRPESGRGSVGMDLEHGSLLLMDGRIPHCLPKTRRPVGERVNLSFRVLP